MGSWSELKSASFIFFRCQLYRIWSRIHSPCGRLSFSSQLISHHNSRVFTGMALTSYLMSTGDWDARAQPRAAGWDYEVREEADPFQIQHQCTEYVSLSWINGWICGLSSSCFWWLIFHCSRKTVRRCGICWREAQAQIWGKTTF